MLAIGFAQGCSKNRMCVACNLEDPSNPRCISCLDGSQLIDGVCHQTLTAETNDLSKHFVSDEPSKPSKSSKHFMNDLVIGSKRCGLLKDNERHGIVWFWLTLVAVAVVTIFFYRQRTHRRREFAEGSADEYVSVN